MIIEIAAGVGLGILCAAVVLLVGWRWHTRFDRRFPRTASGALSQLKRRRS